MLAGKEDARLLAELKQHLLALSTAIPAQIETANSNGTAGGLSQREQIRHEIENILAADCLYCGEYMIDNIDKPFIDDWDKVNSDWQ